MTSQPANTDDARPLEDWLAARRSQVDVSSPVPLYFQVSELLRDWISTAATVGAQLPSEFELVERLRVSRATVRKAIERLEGHGLVYRRRGTGTFVAERRQTRAIRLTSSMIDLYASGRSVSTRVLERTTAEATEPIAERLERDAGAPVIVLRRLRYADARPFALLQNWLPMDRCEPVLEADLERRSLYEVLATDCNIALGRANQRLQARLPSPEQADLLEQPASEPVMRVLRQAFEADGGAVEWSDCLYPAELCEFVASLEPDADGTVSLGRSVA